MVDEAKNLSVEYVSVGQPIEKSEGTDTLLIITLPHEAWSTLRAMADRDRRLTTGVIEHALDDLINWANVVHENKA